MKVTKSVPITPVQALASEYVFASLDEAQREHVKQVEVAKARFALVLAELGVNVDPTQARYENGQPGPRIEYDVEEVEESDAEKAVAFKVPPFEAD